MKSDQTKPASRVGVQRLVGLRQLVKVQDAYIAALIDELNEVVGLAAAHGWKSSRVEAGNIFQAEIARLRELANK